MLGDKQSIAWALLGFAAALILHGISFVVRLARRKSEPPPSPEPVFDFFEEAPAGYLQIGTDGVITRVNRQDCQIRRLTPTDLIGKNFVDLEARTDPDRSREELKQKLAGGAALEPYHRTVQRPDGSVFTVERREALLRTEQGNLAGLLLIETDITDRQRTEEHALETASELNALFEAFPDLFLRLNADGQVLDCKRGDPRDPLLTPDKFLGRSLEQVLPAETARMIVEGAANARHDNALRIVEYSMKVGESLAFYECRLLPLYWDQTAAVLRNVTERKTAEQKLAHYAEELERKNDELEATLTSARESTKLKSQFLANITNEIRNPMNGVLGMLDSLVGTELTREQSNYADSAKHAANSLLALINDILDASKIDAGRLRLEQISFHMRRLIEELASIFEIRARGKGLRFMHVLPDSFPWMVVGDPGRLRQVLSNLLAHAVKSSEQGGEVRLEMELMHKAGKTITVKFTVWEHNPNAKIPKDFDFLEGFASSNASSTRKYADNELGLAISKQIVDLLGGELGFTRESCWFTAVLERFQPQQQLLSEAEPASLKGVRVLVAGNESITDALRQLLESWGCQPAAVSTGDAIVPAIQDAAAGGNPFRLALVDIDLPDVKKTVADSIRSQMSMLRLIAMTSAPLRGDSIELREEGYSGYLQKPIQASMLQEILAEVLRTREDNGAAETLPFVTRHTLSEQKLVPR